MGIDGIAAKRLWDSNENGGSHFSESPLRPSAPPPTSLGKRLTVFSVAVRLLANTVRLLFPHRWGMLKSNDSAAIPIDSIPNSSSRAV